MSYKQIEGMMDAEEAANALVFHATNIANAIKREDNCAFPMRALSLKTILLLLEQYTMQDTSPTEPLEGDVLVVADTTPVRTLIWADGPLMQLVKHEDDKLYLLSWANVETVPIPGSIDAFTQINYYLATQVTQEQVDAYLHGEVSVYTLQKESPKLYFGPHVNDEDELYRIPYESLHDDYKATKMSFYDPSLAPPA